MFNARNELDQSRFSDDLGESIAEMDEMESIRAHNIVETIHLKYQERLKRHAMLHADQNDGLTSNYTHHTNASSVVCPSSSSSTTSTSSLSSTTSSLSTSTATSTTMMSNELKQNVRNNEIATAVSDNNTISSDNDAGGASGKSTSCEQTKATASEHQQVRDEQSQDLADDVKFNSDLRALAKEPNIFNSIKMAKNNGKVRFSSMMNLSSFAIRSSGRQLSVNYNNSNNHRQRQQTRPNQPSQALANAVSLAKRLKPNLSFATSVPIEPAGSKSPDKRGCENQDRIDQNCLARRSSASSTHSLDSGLFLSRDVSPNQSS